MAEYKHVKEWRRRTKERLVEAFGGQCGICGYDTCVDAIDFHHLNPKEKDFRISGSNVANWNKIVDEVRKCICVCCRCHREIHADITKIPKDIKRFDEKFANYKPERIYDSCKCGRLKQVTRKYCSDDCSRRAKRKVDWDKIDIQSMWLYGKTYVQIGKELGVSDRTVKKWHMRQIADISRKVITPS